MKTLPFLLCLVGTVVATNLYFTDEERREAVLQAVEEVRAGTRELERRIRRSTAEREDDSAARKLSRFFRAASTESVRQGTARIFVEKAVSRAEKKLLQSKGKSAQDSESPQPGSQLTKRELAFIYEESECQLPKDEATCSENAKYRTIDGTCNNVDNPLQGASFTGFKRILPAYYEDGLSQINGLLQSESEGKYSYGPFNPPTPSARLVSSTIIRDRLEEDPWLTHLHMAWGQFIDHDFDLAVEPSGVECDLVSCESDDLCAPIRVPADDQTFGFGTARNGSCLPFVRSLPACPTGVFEARNPINEITSYHDASQVYGNTKFRADFLREFSGGRLKDTADPPRKPSLLRVPPCPPGDDGSVSSDCCPNGQEYCFVAGDKRANEVISLTIMHTLWVREHNRIVASLAELNPSWDDERLYQEARKIVGAEMQKVTYYEYLPILFGPNLSDKLLGDYPGYDTEIDASTSSAFGTAAFRFGHSQVQDTLHRLDNNYNPIPEGHLSLVDAFFNPEQYDESGGTDPIMRGLVAQPARAVDEFLSSSISNRLFETNGVGMDLASINTMRGRDHGLPPYWVWKQYCKNKFGIESDIKNELTWIRLLQTYGGKNSIDLYVGGLAEEQLAGSIVGATFACIMAIHFESLRCGDSYYFERPGVFPDNQLAEIKKTSMARIICDNGDEITNIQLNPFKISEERVPCSEIPSLSLVPWAEEPVDCYLKFQVEPNSDELTFFVRNRPVAADEKFTRVKYTFPASNNAQTQCAPINYPSPVLSTEIVVQPTNGILRNECAYTKNMLLPNSTVQASGTYRAILDDTVLVDSPSNGVYTSEEDCNTGSDVVATFVCPNQAI